MSIPVGSDETSVGKFFGRECPDGQRVKRMRHQVGNFPEHPLMPCDAWQTGEDL
jgi:hypothetical protein